MLQRNGENSAEVLLQCDELEEQLRMYEYELINVQFTK